MSACGRRCGQYGKSVGAKVRNNLLLVLLISGVTIGLLIGVLVNPEVNRVSDPEKKATTVMLIGFPGELLMNMLRMLILPLVMASLITAVSGLNPTEAGRIGRRTIIYYMSTMVLTALLGLVLVVTIQPGKRDKPGEQGTFDDTVKYRNLDSLLDILRYSLIGICSLVAARVAEMDDVWVSMQKLGMLIVTDIVGLLIHTLIVLPIIFFAFTRKNPYKFMKGLSDAVLTAFSIASSVATLPITIRCVEENNGINSRISRYMLPLGATVNMDGSALNRPVVIIFVAQLNDVDMSPGKIVTVCVMSVLIAFGAAAVGLPLHDLGLILAVDWLLDRFITVVNVIGDAMGMGIIDHLSRHELRETPEENNNPQMKYLDDDQPDAQLMTSGV